MAIIGNAFYAYMSDDTNKHQCGGIDIKLPNFEKLHTDPVPGIFGLDLPARNVIYEVLSSVGLEDKFSGGDTDLNGVDIHNADAGEIISTALLYMVSDSMLGIMYDPVSDKIITYSVGLDEGLEGIIDVWVSVDSYYTDKPKCLVLNGMDLAPYLTTKDAIPFIPSDDNRVYEWTQLADADTSCTIRLYNYLGCISYKNPRFDEVYESNSRSVISLEKDETLMNVVYSLITPDNIDVMFDNTSLIEVVLTLEDLLVEGTVIESEDKYSCRPPCYKVDTDVLHRILDYDEDILGIEKVIVHTYNYYSTSTSSNYSEDGCINPDVTTDVSLDCSNFNSVQIYVELSAGSDYVYEIVNNNKSINLGIPYIQLYTPSYINPALDPVFVRLPQSLDSVSVKAKVYILVKVDRPSLRVADADGKYIHHFNLDEDYSYKDAFENIYLCAVPIISKDPIGLLGYSCGNGFNIVDSNECVLDKDPHSVQDFVDNVCEEMKAALNNKQVFNIHLPIDKKDVFIDKAEKLTELITKRYTHSNITANPFSVKPTMLGKLFRGGIINKITYSYQDSSSYRANIEIGDITYGIGGGGDYSYRRPLVDSPITKQANVVGDVGDGYQYIVNVPRFGQYRAYSTLLGSITVGDVVNVTIYNNPAESL